MNTGGGGRLSTDFPWHDLGVVPGGNCIGRQHHHRRVPLVHTSGTTVTCYRCPAADSSGHKLHKLKRLSVMKFYGVSGRQEDKILLEVGHLWL